MSQVKQYFSELKHTLDLISEVEIEETIGILHSARLEGKQIFIMGNGGSASTATHFVCDLAKNTRHDSVPHYKVIGLSDNMAIF